MKQAGLPPDRVIAASIDETPRRSELPRALVRRLAAEKAQVVFDQIRTRTEDVLILAADTVVACGRRCLAKPKDESDARAFLTLLSGRSHQVLSGVAVIDRTGKIHERVVMTRVKFKRLDPAEISAYISTSEWEGKAGGYAIQERGAVFVKSINGSYTNVVGLPVFDVVQMLNGCGYRTEMMA